MRRKTQGTWFWNTGQANTWRYLSLYLLVLFISTASGRPDFLDSMSRQFFGTQNDDRGHADNHHRQDPDPFAQMFGSQSQPVPARPHQPPPPNRPYQHRPPQRQGYYAPPHHAVVAHHPHHAHPPQSYPNYNGPPPIYGHQQGFGQVKTEGNETKTEGFPREGTKSPLASHYPGQPRHPHVSPEYHIQPQHQPIEYHHKEPVEYHHQPPVEYHHQPPVEYHHAPPHQVEYHEPAVVEEHHEIHHPPHEVVEYHHEPPVEYHHPKPKKGFRISFAQPSPDLKIVDQHLKLPAVKFRFHINPKIMITTNTKDPLDKKHHHDDEHDLEPFPPPDAFADHEAPPSFNKQTIQHYPVDHHEHYPVVHHEPYPVAHEVVKHYPAAYPEAKHYPVEHHAVAHHPSPHEYTYDLSGGHSHLKPHRSHYEPMFKVKTRPIVITESPPPPPTTTPRPSTTTSRTTSTSTTRATTTRRTRNRTRAQLTARNPGFSVAFTQASTTATTSVGRQGDASEASTTSTRRSIFGSNSEREKEGVGISARKDDQGSATTSMVTSSTTTTTKPTTTSTTTTQKPITSTTTTTTTTTQKPTTSTTTTTQKPTTTTTTTTQKPTTTTTTTTQKPTTTSTTTTKATTTRRVSSTPAEETTPRTTPVFNVGSNEIDMQKVDELPRRRPEPLKEESLTTIERSETFDVQNSESVKIIETTMLIDGKNQTVKFYYITQPIKLPLDLFQKMTGQKAAPNGMSVLKIRKKRFVMSLDEFKPLLHD
ncbi:hypothetical protein JTE90_026327 [Oedothorax gibbosus]|uniref:Uncharacterized protein n=1 Tax=Oedothorax gibbosus TaxID=931172 RepID=A0AAV6U5L6_9ARAC|nr:hypothetical protein JTE90_026327 [Oedothorax gibbosus]